MGFRFFFSKKFMLIGGEYDTCPVTVLKYDGIRSETRFRLSAKRTSPFKSAGVSSSVDYWHPRCVYQLLLLAVMLGTPCSEVVWRVLATHSIGRFPLHFPCRASPCAMIFQLESTYRHCRYLKKFPKLNNSTHNNSFLTPGGPYTLVGLL